MRPIISGDPVLDRVAALPPISPDPQTRARVRARCHDMLKTRQRASRPGIAGVMVDGALGFVSLLYLAGAMAQAVRLIAAIH